MAEYRMEDLLTFSIKDTVPEGAVLEVQAQGDWVLKNLSSAMQRVLSVKQKEIVKLIRSQKIKKIQLKYIEPKAQQLSGKQSSWGSLLLSFFRQLKEEAQKRNIVCDSSLLPQQMQELLQVSYASPANPQQKISVNIFRSLGSLIFTIVQQIKTAVDFVGEVTQAMLKFFAGKATVSARDVWQEIYNASASSLPIISLVSVLLGLILAFVSAVQLQVLGAEIYVSSLITVSMVRVMSPVLTGIVIAGRIGASYAATIGSMQVNEEVDALKTFGINPIEFLVLPRFLALSLMMPFLTVYSDFMGILGGYAVIYFGFDISFYAFLDNVQTFARLHQIFIGLFHAFVFGIIIALSGCYQGIISGRDAEAVGRATTMAVVHSIIGIIVSTSILTIILSGFGL